MAGVDFTFLAGVVLFLFSVWLMGRVFQLLRLPRILGELLIGIILGPRFLDVVPFASDGSCPFPNIGGGGSDPAVAIDGNASGSQAAGRMLAGSSSDCFSIHVWDGKHGPDAWSFVGTLGVTMLIMESGMHINFEKVALVGLRAFVVAIIGTALPLVTGMALVEGFFPGRLYPDGFAAGCALAPTSVGISIKLLDDAKMLNSLAGQTTLTAAFIDDVFSLVLLVLLRSLAAGNPNPGIIVGKLVGAFGFLGFGIVLAKFFYPPVMHWLMTKIPEQPGTSMSYQAQAHLGIMLLSLVGFAAVGDQIGSHLLGAFVAGMCFTKVPLSHHIWTVQLKRILKWFIRIFFAATVGFAVPVGPMLTKEAFLRGLAIGIAPGIVAKLVSGIPARMPYKSAEQKRLSAKASVATCGGTAQPLQYLVGTAMIARGEFAFLVAYSAHKLQMMSNEAYASVTWGLVWALVAAPFLFKWALGVYTRAAPVLRASLIGGGEHSGEDFIITLSGEHHAGLLHEVLDVLNAEGLDIVEAHAAVGGGQRSDKHEDCDAFIVRPRGAQKDFDDEKLLDLKKALIEMLPGADVHFSAMGSMHDIADVEGSLRDEGNFSKEAFSARKGEPEVMNGHKISRVVPATEEQVAGTAANQVAPIEDVSVSNVIELDTSKN